MKFFLNRGGAVLLSMLLLFTSCGDADLFDTDKWTNEMEGWTPGVSLKILQGSFTLWDLINQGDDDVVVKDGNDLIIQYTEKGIYHIGIDEVFDMSAEDLEFSSDTIPNIVSGVYGVLDDSLVIPLRISTALQEVPDGCELKEIQASARFELPVIGYPYKIEARFPDIEMNGEVLHIRDSVPADSVSVHDLDDFTLTLNAEKKVNLEVKIVIPAGTEVTNPNLNLKFGLKDLKFKKAEGKITVDPIAIAPDKFKMNVDFLDKIGGTFKFTKPELNIILRNKGIGVPMSVDATFSRQDAEGGALTLKLKEGKELITSGNIQNVMIPDTLGLNRDNSNIVDFLTLPLTDDISYQGTVTVNPKGAGDNVIYSDGEIDLDAYVRIPFALSAEGLNYKDTLNDINIDPKYADKIKEGVITITAVNGLPLNLQIPSLVLLGENGETLERLTAVKGRDVIQAADGKESVLEFNMTQSQAKKLGQTKKILLEVKASTTNNQEVTVAADAKLAFNLKVFAKAEITDLDDF